MPIYWIKMVAVTRIDGKLQYIYEEDDWAEPAGFDERHRHAPAEMTADVLRQAIESEHRANGEEFTVEMWRLTDEEGNFIASYPPKKESTH